MDSSYERKINYEVENLNQEKKMKKVALKGCVSVRQIVPLSNKTGFIKSFVSFQNSSTTKMLSYAHHKSTSE